MAKILIVDDDRRTTQALPEELTGHDVTILHDGFNALCELGRAYARQRPFELLILDCICPHVDGFTMAKIVRLIERNGTVRRAKIALISSWGKTIAETALVKESGADFYWAKPEDLLRLSDLVAEVLNA